ncbi:MAG: site-2 protease family protein [Alphaproteobacteria bacterium]|nr:site-2 protease family protein [Alphaproteobacteria bacterium]
MIDLLGSGLLSVAAFLAVISFVVVIHELGHYWAGRVFGVHAEAFSIGFGSTLVSWTDRLGTQWRISALPLGGFVRFRGDENAASAPDRETLARLREERTDADTVLHFKPVWQRAIIVAAGPVANFILAAVLFAVIGLARGEVTVQPLIGVVQAGEPAAEAGFQPGDEILTMDGRRVDSFLDVMQHVGVRAGVPVDFTVSRNGETVALTATPARRMREDGLGGERALGFLGIGLSREAERTRVCCNLVQAPIHGVERTFEIAGTIASYMARLVTGRASLEHVNGPLGIATTAGQVANAAASGGAASAGAAGEGPTALERAGRVAISLLAFSALLSVALGLMNLLPIPVLDGGHLVYYAYEAVTQHPPSAALQDAAFRVGFMLLIGVMIVATWNDLSYLRALFS